MCEVVALHGVRMQSNSGRAHVLIWAPWRLNTTGLVWSPSTDHFHRPPFLLRPCAHEYIVLGHWKWLQLSTLLLITNFPYKHSKRCNTISAFSSHCMGTLHETVKDVCMWAVFSFSLPDVDAVCALLFSLLCFTIPPVFTFFDLPLSLHTCFYFCWLQTTCLRNKWQLLWPVQYILLLCFIIHHMHAVRSITMISNSSENEAFSQWKSGKIKLYPRSKLENCMLQLFF